MTTSGRWAIGDLSGRTTRRTSGVPFSNRLGAQAVAPGDKAAEESTKLVQQDQLTFCRWRTA